MSSDEKKKSCILGKKLNSRQTFEKYRLQQKPNRRVAAEVETQEVLKLPCSRLQYHLESRLSLSSRILPT